MNETGKTAIFVLLAAALVAGAYFSRPKLTEYTADAIVGKALFPQFTDPLAIKSLEIVKLDASGERSDFRIIEVNGIWSIPSHDNYPADAKDQMGRVAEALTGLTVLEVIQPEESGIDTIAFQTQYGVIDPSSDDTLIAEAVGTKITLGGANNETFVNLIIGKRAAGGQSQEMMGEDEGSLRYVRIANQAPVYVIDIDPSQFSTNFDQWIEKNLLDVRTFDIKEIYVDEYAFSVELELTREGLMEVRSPTFVGDITLGYDGSAVGADKWSLARWMTFEGDDLDYKERQLEPGKELDTDTLDAMVSALDDLKIVSVLKKPAELASALREGKPFDTIVATAQRATLTSIMESTQETGFWLVRMSDLRADTEEMKVQLLSNEGDIQLRLKDGIVYNLRFGELTGTESEVPLGQFDAPFSIDSMTKMVPNRYLFITAEFDPAIIPLPELRDVPEIPEEEEADELAELTREKEMAERLNQREQERYDAALDSGKKRAAKLSYRFADWYYVISDDVYKDIHLTNANVFRSATPDGESWGRSILDGLDLESILGTDHLPELPVMDGLELE
ncbi:MAG: DUF4340 domain-containing protein [Planctomycetaceae bacterium]|nr:DUF4340 domain-containing protein [Planctomycetaceae bacterium]